MQISLKMSLYINSSIRRRRRREAARASVFGALPVAVVFVVRPAPYRAHALDGAALSPAEIRARDLLLGAVPVVADAAAPLPNGPPSTTSLVAPRMSLVAARMSLVAPRVSFMTARASLMAAMAARMTPTST